MARRYSTPTAECLALPGLDLDRLVFGFGLYGTGLASLAYYIVANFGALGASAVTYIPGVVALVIGRFLLGDEIHPLGYVAMVLTLGRDRTWGGEGGPCGNAPADVNRHDGPVWRPLPEVRYLRSACCSPCERGKAV